MPLPSDLFTRLTAGDTFFRALDVFCERWLTFAAVAAFAYLPFLLFMITMNSMLSKFVESALDPDGVFSPDSSDSSEQSAALAELFDMYGGIIRKLILENLFYSLVGIFAEATIVMVVAEIYAGRNPAVVGCAKKAASFYCNIICAGFIVGIGAAAFYVVAFGIVAACFISDSFFVNIFGAFISVAAAFAAVYVSVAMLIISPVIMVEGMSAPDALKRCWGLAYNNRCFIYCTIFVLNTAMGVMNGTILSIMFAGHPMAQFSVLGSIVSSMFFLVMFPANAILITVVYFKIRTEEEGLNRDVLLNELGAEATGGTQYASLAVESNCVLDAPLTPTNV